MALDLRDTLPSVSRISLAVRACFPGVLSLMCVFGVACGGGDDGGGGGGGGDPTMICTNSCEFANDGECDDGGEGADFDECSLGTDCGDCGPRTVDTNTGTADAGSGQGCPGGCPVNQSCILDECVDNNNGGDDNGEEGDTCSCDGTGVENTYVQCSGTSDGCTGFGGTGQLSCLGGETGSGTCNYFCSSSDEGTQGSCPSGYTCSNSGLESVAGGQWYLCYN